MITSSIAANAYDRAKQAVSPAEGAPQGVTAAAVDFAKVMDQVDIAATGAMTGKGGGLPDMANVDPAQMAEATKMLQDPKGIGGQLGGLNLPGGLSGLFGKK